MRAYGPHMADAHEPAPWMVRILDPDGNLHGAGMLVSSDRVLTCAHVIPAEPVAEFVDPADGVRVPATVAFAAPTGDSQRGDIALLALKIPQPDRVTAKLRRFPVGRADRFRAYAFPQHPHIGSWSVTTLVGRAGPGGEWMQLQHASGLPVSPGFSGAGVLAEDYGHLVGMIVAANPADGLAYMIPADTLARYLPGVPWIVGEAPIPRDFAERRPSATPDADTLEEISQFVTGPPGANVRVVVSGPDDSDASAAVHEAVMSAERLAGGVDLAIDCTGMSAAEIQRRIAERSGVDERNFTGPQAPPMTIVLRYVDRAIDPGRVLRTVVRPLSERDPNRILVTFADADSAAVAMAKSIERERSSRHADRSAAEAERAAVRAAIARAGIAEQRAEQFHRRAAAVIAGLPPLEMRAEGLRTAYSTRRGDPTGLAELRIDAAEAEAEADSRKAGLRKSLRAHEDLRRLLTDYQRRSAQEGRAEEPELTELFGRAYALLHDGPADQAMAEVAVDEFAAAVRGVAR